MKTTSFTHDDSFVERSPEKNDSSMDSVKRSSLRISGDSISPTRFQGAGGVGGLVAVSVGGDFYFPGYDNNGNVVGYWDESGGLVAEYSYDAFGNTISEAGPMSLWR